MGYGYEIVSMASGGRRVLLRSHHPGDDVKMQSFTYAVHVPLEFPHLTKSRDGCIARPSTRSNLKKSKSVGGLRRRASVGHHCDNVQNWRNADLIMTIRIKRSIPHIYIKKVRLSGKIQRKARQNRRIQVAVVRKL